MKDAFHGSARPAHGLVTARRGPSPTIVRPYRGCTRHTPRRGTARTAPKWIRRRRRPLLRPVAPHRAGGRRPLGRHPVLERTGPPLGPRDRSGRVPGALRHPRPPGDAQQPDQPEVADRRGRGHGRPSPTTAPAGTAGPPTQRLADGDGPVGAHRAACLDGAATARGGHRGDARPAAHPRRALRQLAGRRPGPRVGIGLGVARQSDSTAVTPSRRV